MAYSGYNQKPYNQEVEDDHEISSSVTELDRQQNSATIFDLNKSQTDEIGSDSEISSTVTNERKDNISSPSSSSSSPSTSPQQSGKRQKSTNNQSIVNDATNINTTTTSTTTTTTTTTTNNSSSSSSSFNNVMNGIAASPPRFAALEEIMKAANGVSNMFLSHQIAMDENFRIERPETSENSLKNQVESVMKQAFWDLLQAQLEQTPPSYQQALSLLHEIKQDLCSFLLPQHTKLKQEIDEVLDIELIQQQAENGALDVQRYAQYVISVMARLCAPVRDEKIRQLTQTKDIVQLFKGIMELADVMKLDMANFTISQMRPQLIQHSVEYEKQKFKEFLQVQSKMAIDGLANTRQWLHNCCDQLDLNENDRKMLLNKVIIAAYVELLKGEMVKGKFPETLAIDESKLDLLQRKLYAYVLVGSVLLLSFASVSALQSVESFKQEFKRKLLVLLTTTTTSVDDKTAKEGWQEKDRLSGIGEFAVNELQKSLQQHACPSLSDEKVAQLKQQIQDVANPDNRVRIIIRRRILEFIELVLSSNTAAPVQIPSGLSVLQEELLSLTGSLVKIVSFNRSVFGEYYVKIIEEMLPKQ